MKTILSNGLEVTSVRPISPDTIALMNMDIDSFVERAAADIATYNCEFLGMTIAVNEELFYILFKAILSPEHMTITVERFEKIEQPDAITTWPKYFAYMTPKFSIN